MSDPFATERDLEGIKLADFEGRLVVLERAGAPVQMSTEYGDGEAVPSRLIDVDGDDHQWQELLTWNGFIRSDLKSTAKPILGRLVRGDRNALLLDRDVKPADKKRAIVALEAANEALLA